MDEIKKCLEVLGLKPGATEDEIKQAYRELVMVWHPDRFAADSPLQAKAEAKLKEINAAYEYLNENAFGQLSLEEEAASESESASTPTSDEGIISGEMPDLKSKGSIVSKIGMAILLLGLIGAIGASGWLWFHNKKSPEPQAKPKPFAEAVAVATNPVEPVTAPPPPMAPAPTTVAITSASNLLFTMRAIGDRHATQTDEGLVLKGETRLLAPDECSPPFVIHAIAKTDLTNIRLSYGPGRLIFNWEMNPDELRFHDPATGQVTPVGGQGRVGVNEWQDIEWYIETNSSRVLVNGKERASFKGNYAHLSDLPGIGTALSATIVVKQFEVRKLAPETPPPAPNLAAGLVLYYPFDKDEFNVVTDQSPFHNNGAVQSAKFVSDGKVGGGIHFKGSSGSGDIIVVPNSPSLVSMQKTRQLTICCWVKASSLPGQFPVIMVKGGNHPPRAFGGYELDIQDGDDGNVVFPSGKTGTYTTHARELWGAKQLDEWAHIAVTINGPTDTGKIYINGKRVGDESHTGDWRTALLALPNKLYIGGPDPEHNSNRAWFDGSMDELRIYARVLTEQEIRSLPGFKKSNP